MITMIENLGLTTMKDINTGDNKKTTLDRGHRAENMLTSIKTDETIEHHPRAGIVTEGQIIDKTDT